MKRDRPETGETYHIYNRGVEKRNVFLSKKDYFRFVHDLFEFNDINPTINLSFHYDETKEVGLPNIRGGRKKRKLLVELMAFCLMPNHFHLIVRQKRDGGITEFMRKLGTGYTNYFNQKYERVGPLFQGKYKSVHLKSEAHFVYLPYYIHLNPLSLKSRKKPSETSGNTKAAIKFLENYKWSSFPDYVGKKNFPSVTQREFLNNFLGDPKQHKKGIVDLIKNPYLEELHDITLE